MTLIQLRGALRIFFAILGVIFISVFLYFSLLKHVFEYLIMFSGFLATGCFTVSIALGGLKFIARAETFRVFFIIAIGCILGVYFYNTIPNPLKAQTIGTVMFGSLIWYFLLWCFMKLSIGGIPQEIEDEAFKSKQRTGTVDGKFGPMTKSK